MRLRLIAAALAAAALVPQAAAQDLALNEATAIPPRLAQDATLVCANAGVRYQVGEYACIAACHGNRRLARCDAVADRASWTYVSDACPSAMINPPWPSDWSEVPAESAMTPIPLTVNSSAIAPAVAPRIAAFVENF